MLDNKISQALTMSQSKDSNLDLTDSNPMMACCLSTDISFLKVIIYVR